MNFCAIAIVMVETTHESCGQATRRQPWPSTATDKLDDAPS